MTAARAIVAWLRSAEVPSELPRWSPTWASDVARDAERLRKEGVEAESAWWQAAALHRPAGVPEPRRTEREGETCRRPLGRPPSDLIQRIRERLAVGPATLDEVVAAVRAPRSTVHYHLLRCAERAGHRERRAHGRAGRAIWRLR